MDNEKWTELHTKLQEVMKREIEMMRQLLANLHQEEMFIVRKDKTYWNQLMEERAALISQLSELREYRLSTTANLESMAKISYPNIPLEEVLPRNDENSWEILALRDQILALLDRMNLQSSRNEMLVQLELHQAHLEPLPEKKMKISIATLPPEEYKKEA
jgi:hypothetical protein